MSRELDLFAKEYQSKKATVLRNNISLYQTTMSAASASFLREVESQCKRQKLANVVLIAVIPEQEKTAQSKWWILELIVDGFEYSHNITPNDRQELLTQTQKSTPTDFPKKIKINQKVLISDV